MKKGDLVKPREISLTQDRHTVPSLDFDTAIVISDPYATVFVQQDEVNDPVYSVEKIVVDILVKNRVIQKYPIDAIIRVT